MLGGVGVDGPDAGVEVVDQHDRRLPAGQRGGHPLAVHGGLQLGGDFAVGGVGQLDAGGDQHAGGHLVVLGLADQVGGDMRRVGGVVGEDRDLGGPGLGVDADLRAADPLGGGDVDVAGPGDHVDRRQFGPVGVGAAVGQQRDGLGAADGPYLVDAQQRGRGQDRRVRQSVELAACGGLAITSESTPAVCAGTTFMTTLDG